MLENFKSASVDAANTAAFCFVPLVVKSVLEKEQEFQGGTLTVKPYEGSMKMDNHDYQVFHYWYNGLYNSSKLYNKVIFTSSFCLNSPCIRIVICFENVI